MPRSTIVDLCTAVATLSAHTSGKAQGEAVENIVDPFLFPYAWRGTRDLIQRSVTRNDCVSRCSDGEIVKMPPEEDCRQNELSRYRMDMAWLWRYQWLPFDVVFEDQVSGRSRQGKNQVRDLRGIQHLTFR